MTGDVVTGSHAGVYLFIKSDHFKYEPMFDMKCYRQPLGPSGSVLAAKRFFLASSGNCMCSAQNIQSTTDDDIQFGNICLQSLQSLLRDTSRTVVTVTS